MSPQTLPEPPSAAPLPAAPCFIYSVLLVAISDDLVYVFFSDSPQLDSKTPESRDLVCRVHACIPRARTVPGKQWVLSQQLLNVYS